MPAFLGSDRDSTHKMAFVNCATFPTLDTIGGLKFPRKDYGLPTFASSAAIRR